MSFTVGALPYSGWEQAISLLNSLGWAHGALSDIENWLHLDDGVGHVVVLHRRPEYLIAAAIAQGKTPAEACQDWQQQAEGLLKWLRHNRRRACLVETDALLAENTNLEPLCERLGLKLSEHTLAHVHAQLPHVQPLSLLCALQAVRQSEACQSLLAELEASTLPLNNRSFVTPSLDIDVLAEKLNADTAAAEQKKQNTQNQLEQAQRDIEKLDQQLKTGQEESGLLLEQLHLVQEEFDSKAVSQKDLAQQLAKSQQQQQKEHQNNHNLSAELKQVRAQAEKAESTGKKEQQTNQALAEELTQAKDQAEKAAKADKKNQEEMQRTQEENSLLLEQLHLVQEEFDSKAVSQKDLEQQLAKSQQQQQKEHQNNHNLSAELKQARAQADKAESTGKEEQQTNQALAEELTQAKDRAEKAAKTDKKNQEELQSTQEENSLLLEQLHLVQEELEKRFVAEQELVQEPILVVNEQDNVLKRADQSVNDFQSEPIAAKANTGAIKTLRKLFRLQTPEQKMVKRHAALIEQTGLFDEDWYLKSYPDVAENTIGVVEHYLKFGAAENRNPSPYFDTGWYLSHYPDVAQKGINPLLHYVKFGEKEGRAMNPNHCPMLADEDK